MTVATLLHKALGRQSHDRAQNPEIVAVEPEEFAFRPDLMLRWDDETLASTSPACERVPTRRARTTSVDPLTRIASTTR